MISALSLRTEQGSKTALLTRLVSIFTFTRSAGLPSTYLYRALLDL